MTTTSRSLSRDLTQWPATDRVLSTDRTADDHSTFIPSRTAADSLCGPETATVRRRKCEKLDFSSCGEKDLQLDRKRFADRQQFCQHYSTRFFRAACAVDLWSKSGWSPGGHKGGSRRLSQGWRVEKGYPSPPRNGYECFPPNKGYREETIPLPRKINLSLKMTCFDKFWVVYFVRALPDKNVEFSAWSCDLVDVEEALSGSTEYAIRVMGLVSFLLQQMQAICCLEFWNMTKSRGTICISAPLIILGDSSPCPLCFMPMQLTRKSAG